jgi:hypothetical protein
MNADASRPVAAALTAGVIAPALRGTSAALLIGAAVALLAGLFLVALAVPRSSRVAEAARRHPGDVAGVRGRASGP